MKILIIQENGRREENRAFRECFALQRAFTQLGVECGVWGAGHANHAQPFTSVVRDFDAVLSLENYPGPWHPNLASITLPKLFWCIDAHMGLARYLEYVRTHRFDVVFSATEMFVSAFARLAAASDWLPNALDATLIDRQPGVSRDVPLGFCGNTANRTGWLEQLKRRWEVRHDRMVLGVEMVRAIQRYQIHWNRNVSVDVNFRTFETLGCETFLLTNHMAGLNQLFTPGRTWPPTSASVSCTRKLPTTSRIPRSERGSPGKDTNRPGRTTPTFTGRSRYSSTSKAHPRRRTCKRCRPPCRRSRRRASPAIPPLRRPLTHD